MHQMVFYKITTNSILFGGEGKGIKNKQNRGHSGTPLVLWGNITMVFTSSTFWNYMIIFYFQLRDDTDHITSASKYTV